MAKKLSGAVIFLGRVLSDIVEAHLPISIWLDFSTLRLYRARSSRSF